MCFVSFVCDVIKIRCCCKNNNLVSYKVGFHIKANLIKIDTIVTYSINLNMSDIESQKQENNPRVKIEYCGACDYSGYCIALGQIIKKSTPNAEVHCERGRQGSFEVVVNDKLVYSKLQTMALPDFDEVAEVINSTSKGEEPRLIKGQQPINCAIS